MSVRREGSAAEAPDCVCDKLTDSGVTQSGNSLKGHTKWHLAALSLAPCSLLPQTFNLPASFYRAPLVSSLRPFSTLLMPPLTSRGQKRATCVTFLTRNALASTRGPNVVSVRALSPPAKSIKMYFTGIVRNFPLLSWFFLYYYYLRRDSMSEIYWGC